MPQAMVGIRPPAENLGRRTNSQDLMDHATQARATVVTVSPVESDTR
jgi:hypothetical protein